MDILSSCKERYMILMDEEEKVLRELSGCPKGQFECYRVKNSYKWYCAHNDETAGRIRTYIPKKNVEYARKLARKTYLQKRLLDIRDEMKRLKVFISSGEKSKNRVDDLLKNKPGIHPLLAHIDEMSEWENAEYDKNTLNPEQLIIRTPKGEMVRSKSELLIAMKLFELQIPYRYECGLQLASGQVYPDFTIKHPFSGKIYIWEHFGLIDQLDYRMNMIRKNQHYIENGYIPGHNLITTYETKDRPLDPEYIRMLIEYHFT